MSQSRVIPWAQPPCVTGQDMTRAWGCPCIALTELCQPSSHAQRCPAVTIPCSPQQHSDSDSEPEFSSLSPSIPSAIPVTGESYCNCENQSEAPYCSSLHALHRVRDCRCGEEDECKGLPWGLGWGNSCRVPSLPQHSFVVHPEAVGGLPARACCHVPRAQG